MFLIYLNTNFLFFIIYCHKQKAKYIFQATFLLQSTKLKFNNSNILQKHILPYIKWKQRCSTLMKFLNYHVVITDYR